MKTSPPSDVTHNANEIGTAIANNIIMLIIIFHSHEFFNKHLYDIKNLARHDWQKVDIAVTSDIQFQFLRFRTGENHLYIERNHQEFYSERCIGRLTTICRDLKKEKIKPTSLNFYTLIQPENGAYTQLKLNTLTFDDPQGQQQIYRNLQYAPNSPEVILQAKKDMAWFFPYILIGYLIFGFLSSIHNMAHIIKSSIIKRYMNYAIVIFFTLNFLYFLFYYILMCIRL